MAVKEKLLQGGGLGPAVGGEDHLPVEVTHVTCSMKKRLTHVLILHMRIIGVLNSNTAHSKFSSVCNITLLCPSLGKQSIASPTKTYFMAKADNAFF